MKKLKIAIVCDGINTIAGSFISTKRFALLLKKRGHKIIIITSKNPHIKKNSFYGMRSYPFPSILLPKSENQIYLSYPKVSALKKIFIKEKIDIVHLIIPVPSSFSALNAARQLGIKVVAHSHTQPENIFLNLPKFLPTKFLSYLFYKYMVGLYKQADILICPTKFAEKKIKKYENKLKTAIISNGVDIEKFHHQIPKDFIKKFKLNKVDRFILFVGRLHPEKDIKTLIKSMPTILEEFPNIHLLIVGFGFLQRELENLSSRLNLKKKITFCGRVSDKELKMAYILSEIFILPSLAELEGMAVLEAMATKNPIIIANSTESAAVDFVNENGYLFEPKNEKDLSSKVISILSDKIMRNKMAAKSLEIAKEHSIKKSVDKIEHIYDNLLK